jgi:hypothetical protein
MRTQIKARKDPQEIKRALILWSATDPLAGHADRGKQCVAKHAVQEGRLVKDAATDSETRRTRKESRADVSEYMAAW